MTQKFIYTNIIKKKKVDFMFNLLTNSKILQKYKQNREVCERKSSLRQGILIETDLLLNLFYLNLTKVFEIY